MFDQDAEETFHAAEDGPVEHEGNMLGVVFADKSGAEAIGQVSVNLDGAKLPHPAQGVGDLEFELGP